MKTEKSISPDDIKTHAMDITCPFCEGNIDCSFSVLQTSRVEYNFYTVEAILGCLNIVCGAKMGTSQLFSAGHYGFSLSCVDSEIDDIKTHLREVLSKRWGKWMGNAAKLNSRLNEVFQ